METFNYKYGQKNNWRRTIWNEIKQRSNDPQKEIVLYLADEKDNDRDVALAKGFKAENLIAGNKDRQICNHLRRQGKICICGDISEIVNGWDHKSKILPTIIFADFCGTIKNNANLFLGALTHKACKIIIVNNLRGRENIPNFQEFSEEQKEISKEIIFSKNAAQIARKGLHRGVYSLQLFYEIALRLKYGVAFGYQQISEYDMYFLNRFCAPNIFSYKSTSGQIFDSLITNIPTLNIDFKNIPEFQKIRNEIRANMAVRTMRTRGDY